MAETDSFTLVQLPGLLWHWLTDPDVISVFLVVLATMTANFVARRLIDQLARRIESTRTIWDDALLNALLVKQFSDRQIAIDPKVVNFVLPRMERSFTGIAALVSDLDKAALKTGKPISVKMARLALGL